MSIILTPLIDAKYSKELCYEIGLNYFKIRKAFIDDKVLFHKLYLQAYHNTNNKEYYSNKIEEIKSYTFIPNTNTEDILKHTLLYIWRGSFSIVNCSIGSFIIIAYAWNYYLLIEPITCKANEFINDELFNYLMINYKDIILYITQYRIL
jgi:hypothetical protein